MADDVFKKVAGAFKAGTKAVSEALKSPGSHVSPIQTVKRKGKIGKQRIQQLLKLSKDHRAEQEMAKTRQQKLVGICIWILFLKLSFHFVSVLFQSCVC